jgi:hypothetical protein
MLTTSKVCPVFNSPHVAPANKWKENLEVAADWDHPRFGFDNYIVSNLSLFFSVIFLILVFFFFHFLTSQRYI